jgi:hypothetical protein
MGYAHYAGAPAPVSPAGFSDNFSDIDGTVYGSREETDVHGTAGSLRTNMDTPEVVQSPSGAPANPFSKTLATIEPNERGTGEPAGQNRGALVLDLLHYMLELEKRWNGQMLHGPALAQDHLLTGLHVDRPAAELSTPGNTKPSLDVEGFKNMLMTGISSPRSSGPAPVPQAAPASTLPIPPVFESSSTDTSSVSRQSIFEPVQEPHPETPRTSFDMAASDDDRTSLVGETKKEKKKPPPAPKHRHGKLVSSRTPQTVSFEDFKPIEPTASPPTVRRQGSDLNKPLPMPPPTISTPSHIVSQDITHDSPSISDVKPVEIPGQFDATPMHKKAPPPVPLARRHSQLRTSTAGNRSRSNSSLTMSSQHSMDFPIPSPTIALQPAISPSSQKVPPPPPPSRHRGAALTTISTSSANSSSTELSATAAARRPTLNSPTPPPARRSTLTSEPPSPAGLARTSSINSTRNTQRTVSNESSNSANMPPPPPPPRKRTSGGRSSLDKERPTLPPTSPIDTRRASTEYKRNSIDSKRRTSVASESSLKYEYAPAAAESESALYSPREEAPSLTEVDGDKGNILDDMEKFQKEIEELRAKFEHAA